MQRRVMDNEIVSDMFVSYVAVSPTLLFSNMDEGTKELFKKFRLKHIVRTITSPFNSLDEIVNNECSGITS